MSWDGGEEEGLFLAMVDGVPHPIDDEADLLDIAPPGAVVTVDRGGVTLSIWRENEIVHARASAVVEGRPLNGTDGTDSLGSAAIESALVNLGEVDPSRVAPRVCFFCAYSDYEPSTGYGCGHLACFVSSAERYRAAASLPDTLERKYGIWKQGFRWIDELDTCPLWERRPPDYGY